MGTRPFVGEEVFQAGEQEGAKPARCRLDVGERIALEKLAEEFLGQVFRFVRGRALAADERIQGIPVGRTQSLEGVVGRGAIVAPRRHDVRPVGGGEVVAALKWIHARDFLEASGLETHLNAAFS